MDRKVLEVSQVNGYIKQLMDHDYVLQNISVQGEISNYKLHSSGHAYFTLKDKNAAISCVFFKGHRQNCAIAMNNGEKVIVIGSVSVYERDGRYQIYVKEAVKDGLGLLYQKFELLKRECQAKGYFNEEHKLPIPEYALKIGIVTSPTGAAIRDMVNVGKRRNPYAELFLYPALVQGENAYKTIIKGIRYFNNLTENEKVDVIIIGRGGGSIEDLWAFNEKALVESIYQSNIPIISAVGHETDFTLSDFVSDLRAPTPSSGAELAIFDYNRLMMQLDYYDKKLSQHITWQIDNIKQQIDYYNIRLKPRTLIHALDTKKNYINEIGRTMDMLIKNKINNTIQRLKVLEITLDGLNPSGKLINGFAYITDHENKPIRSVKDIKNNDQLNIKVHNGNISTIVKEIKEVEEV